MIVMIFPASRPRLESLASTPEICLCATIVTILLRQWREMLYEISSESISSASTASTVGSPTDRISEVRRRVDRFARRHWVDVYSVYFFSFV